MFNWIKKLFASPKPPPVQIPPASYNKPRGQPPVKRQPFQASSRPSYANENDESVISPLSTDLLSPHSPLRNTIWNQATEPVQHDDVYQSTPSTDGDDSLRSSHETQPTHHTDHSSSHSTYSVDTSTSHSTHHVDTSTSHSSSWDGGSSHSSHDTSSSSFDSGSGGGFDGGSSGGSFD
jgi:hypothetical protein